MARLQCVKCKSDKRDGPKCLKCGHIHGKKGGAHGGGRKKTERPVDGNVARNIKAKVQAEQTWVGLIETEKHRIGLHLPVEKRPQNVSTTPLANMLRYLDDRDLGKPVDTVNHLHDKPIEMNVNLNLAERIAGARRRAALGIDTDGKRSHKRP